MNIVRAKPGDVERIAELNKLFHLDIPSFIWDDADWISKEVAKGRYYKGQEGEKTVSAVCLNTCKDRVSIETIAVDKSLQGRGIGKQMIDFVKRHALKRNIRLMYVSSFQEYGLEGFYTSCGFRKIGESSFEGHRYNQFEMADLR